MHYSFHCLKPGRKKSYSAGSPFSMLHLGSIKRASIIKIPQAREQEVGQGGSVYRVGTHILPFSGKLFQIHAVFLLETEFTPLPLAP